MKIRVEKFCSLATARDWQTWLYKYDQVLYKEFIIKLRQAHGCNENRELMIQMLDIIDKRGHGPQLSTFLQLHYPHMILGSPIAVDQSEWDRLFCRNLLTFPRRKMFVGEPNRLARTVEEFLSDKINYEFFIVGGKAYVEYLHQGEEKLVADIPAKSWLIRAKKNAG